MSRVAIVWLRRDLRLADNAALAFACEHATHVLCVYIHAPEEDTPWMPGAASRWWLHHSLHALNEELKNRGTQLIVRVGASLSELRSLIAESKATLVVWNRLYEPAALARDNNIATALQSDGVEVQQCNSALLFEPWEIKGVSEQGYKVFTPFWRRCMQSLANLPTPLAAPEKILSPVAPRSTSIASLQLLPNIKWDAEFTSHWQPGEAGAHQALDSFVARARDRYVSGRDDISSNGTSRLSPHLHFGELGPKQIFAALQTNDASSSAGNEAFMRELGWREFAHHVLYHFPQTANEPFDARFANYRWERSASLVRAWQRGRTGIPIIDAGMRELWRTGYMHNRVRMLVASFLTKNLRIHWLEGARWFWDTLVDADLANNTLGWQWTAGCGTDAAPYFRIFNPVLQSRRFDSQGIYLRRWVPELAALSNDWIHEPWNAPSHELRDAKIKMGSDYPLPIVDLKRTRELALEGYKALRS